MSAMAIRCGIDGCLIGIDFILILFQSSELSQPYAQDVHHFLQDRPVDELIGADLNSWNR